MNFFFQFCLFFSRSIHCKILCQSNNNESLTSLEPWWWYMFVWLLFDRNDKFCGNHFVPKLLHIQCNEEKKFMSKNGNLIKITNIIKRRRPTTTKTMLMMMEDNREKIISYDKKKLHHWNRLKRWFWWWALEMFLFRNEKKNYQHPGGRHKPVTNQIEDTHTYTENDIFISNLQFYVQNFN